jgi:hypothetical protein
MIDAARGSRHLVRVGPLYNGERSQRVGTKKSGKGRRKVGRKKRRMRSRIRHRKG